MNEQIKQGNTIESNDGQQIMGFVASTDGATVVVVSADGTLRELNPGDAIREGDVLQVTDGSHVTITFADGTTRQLDSGGTFVVAQDSFQQLALVDGGEEQNPEFEALLAALNEGQDITEGQEATAAGEAGAAGGSGDEIGQGLYFNLIGGEVTPTAGIDPDYVPPPTLDPTADTDVQEGVPTVSVSVEVEIEIQDPPDGGEPPTIPTDDYPVIVSGNTASVKEGTSEGGKEVVFILQLDKAYNQDVSVTYELKPGTADNPADWYDGPLVNTVTIPAGETSFPVTVTIVEDHLDEGNETFDIMILSATNATVNPSSNTATVTIFDDDTTPEANDDENSVQEDVLTTTSGNVITGGSAGDVADSDADGDTIVLDAVNGDAGNIGTPIAGNYGTLTLNSDGSYTYELNNDDPAVQGLSEGEVLNDTFNYTIWDTYNEKQTAELTITINGTDDGVILNGLDAEGADEYVDEANLSDGTDPDAPALTQGGSFDFETPDGLDTVSIGGQDFTLAQLQALAGSNVTVSSDYGDLKLTGYTGDEFGGTITYEYTLTATVDNDDVEGADDTAFTDSFAVVVTDEDGSEASDSLDVEIADDQPTLDIAVVASEGEGESEGEDVLITFSGITDHTPVTNYFPGITFTNTDGFEGVEFTKRGAGGMFYTNGSSSDSTYGDPQNLSLDVTFDSPVDNFTFDIIGTDGDGNEVTIDIYQDGVLTDTIAVPLVSVTTNVDLSGYNNITKITVKDVADNFGVGYDNFSYTTGSEPVVAIPNLTTQDAETDGDPTDVDSASASFSSLFTLTQEMGADNGEGSEEGELEYSLNITAVEGASGLSSGGEAITLSMDGDDVVGKTADDTVIFRISVEATGDNAGTVTLTQYEVVDHVEGTSEDDVIGLVSGSISLTAEATITDADGDTATDSETIDISEAFSFDDDAPKVQLRTPTEDELPADLLLDETSAYENQTEDFSAYFVTEEADLDFGADGPADADSDVLYSLRLSTQGVGSGMYALDSSDTLVDGDGYGQGDQILLFTNGSGVIEGKTSADSLDVYFTIAVDEETAEVTFTQLMNIWHPVSGETPAAQDDPAVLTLAEGETLKLVQTLKDGDGDTDEAAINLVGSDVEDGSAVTSFTIKDDGPNAVNDVNPSFSGNVTTNDDFGTDGEGSFLQWTNTSDDQGELTLAGDDGSYTFKWTDDTEPTPENPTVSLSASFNYEIIDADGDISTGTLSFSGERTYDDVPVDVVASPSNYTFDFDETIGAEDRLTDDDTSVIAPEADDLPQAPNIIGSVSVNVSALASATVTGGDGATPPTPQFNATTLTLGTPDDGIDFYETNLTVSSTGETVYLYQASPTVVLGYTGMSTDAEVALKIELYVDVGGTGDLPDILGIDQYLAFDQGDDNDPDLHDELQNLQLTGSASGSTLSIGVTVSASDADYDDDISNDSDSEPVTYVLASSDSTSIRFEDDGPVVTPDTDNVSEGGYLSVDAANGVLADDTSGTDGWTAADAGVVGVAASIATDTPAIVDLDDPTTLNTNIVGQYGTLVLQADGSYTYQANADVIEAGTADKVDTFVYTVKDGDGDLKSTTLKITLSDVTGTPANTTGSVSEAGLTENGTTIPADGSSVGDNSHKIVNGALTFDGGFDNVEAQSGSTLLGTWSVAADGTFSYELTSRTADLVGDETDSFSYAATDDDGNSVTNTVTITIVDDMPSVDPVNAILDNSTPNTLTGSLNLISGADGVSSLTLTPQNDGTFLQATVNGSLDFMRSDGHKLIAISDGAGGFIAVADLDDDGVADNTDEVVFTVSLNGDGTYTVDLIGDLDGADKDTTFSLSDGIKGGNDLDFYLFEPGLDFDNQSVDPNLNDNLDIFGPGPEEGAYTVIKASGYDADGALTVNSSDFSLGVGSGQDVAFGKTLVLEFTRADSWELRDNGGSPSDDGIYDATGDSVKSYVALNSLTLGLRSFSVGEVALVYVYKDDGDGLHYGDQAEDLLGVIQITNNTGISYTNTSLFFTIGQDGVEGPAGMDVEVLNPDSSLLDDYFTGNADWTFDSVELTAAEGSSYKVSAITTSETTTGTEQSLEVTAVVTDGDGDIAGDTFEIVFDGTGAIVGTTGDDVLVGGSGNDILTGDDGADVFLWNAGDAELAPLDVVTDFDAAEGDVLNFADLLTGATDATVGQYLSVADNGAGGVNVTFDIDGAANGSAYDDMTVTVNNITVAEFNALVGTNVVVEP